MFLNDRSVMFILLKYLALQIVYTLAHKYVLSNIQLVTDCSKFQSRIMVLS
jgi:hypothetical protein